MPTGKLREERSLNHQEENAKLLDEFLLNKEAANWSTHTLIGYRYAIADFLAFTLGLSMADVTHHEVSEWVHFLKERGLNARSRSSRMGAVRSFFIYLQIKGDVKDSPTRLVVTRDGQRRLPHWLSVTEMRKLIAAAGNLRDRALIEFMWATGCRISEVLGARMENINWNERTVRVIGKGDKERLVPLSKLVVQSLKSYLGQRNTGAVFLSEEKGFGRNIQQGGVSRTQWGAWRGYWYETDDNGKRVQRSVRLGHYRAQCTLRLRHRTVRLEDPELQTREQAQAALAKHLDGKSLANRFDPD